MLIFVIIVFTADQHCVKRVRIRSYTGPHFPRIFLHSNCIRRDTEYLSIFSTNVGKSRKNADQNNSDTDTFYAVQTISKKPMYKKSL